MIYLLDTNVISEISVRPRPAPEVVDWAKSIPAADVYISVITIAEIEAGIAAAPDITRRARYAQALDDMRQEYQDRIAVIDEPEAIAYVKLHRHLKATGTGIDPPDALIAATALANNWTVATRNAKHFERTGAAVVNPWEHAA
ncbi:type II toxin-antitoxin system VapC family toxin [Streptomyces piniterrae]|uniref:Ribonuclease VapC n=1 Tax=Streptomyces piniterrae TaxID=2571125 RepID=A0A4U0N8S7_9ACTN|nr:type II toxin-antitoxin system VapC family toxin [Streptomyces piniterrae]TJZ46124.1 type II toxin-antitoxin system VapC family toxin [Streptomyces piniterrae]